MAMRAVISSIIITIVMATVLCFAATSAVAQSPTRDDRVGRPVPGERHSGTDETEEITQRKREGTRMVAQVGYFKTTGDRLTFFSADGEQRYLGLENLALQRIAKAVSDRHDLPEQLLWEVTGVFTEYRGSNYLLVTHAVLKSKSMRRPLLAPRNDRTSLRRWPPR